jgi:hypothetical protein
MTKAATTVAYEHNGMSSVGDVHVKPATENEYLLSNGFKHVNNDAPVI